MRPPPMLERDAELSVLADAVQAAAAGRGSLVLVFGEAGIGKSSLVESVRARLPAEGRMLVGHIDSHVGPGIFFHLSQLRPGDLVYVRRADGSLAVFRVTVVRSYAKDHFPTLAVYGPVPDAELRLITCGGTFDSQLGSYLSNTVVYAAQVSGGTS